IASFVIAIVSGLVVLAGIAFSALMVASGDPEQHLPVFGLIGLVICVFLILSLVGLVLGFIALRRQDRRRTFGAIGLGLNALILIGTIGLVLVGTFFSHSNSSREAHDPVHHQDPPPRDPRFPRHPHARSRDHPGRRFVRPRRRSQRCLHRHARSGGAARRRQEPLRRQGREERGGQRQWRDRQGPGGLRRGRPEGSRREADRPGRHRQQG